jgi:hypothetical protein
MLRGLQRLKGAAVVRSVRPTNAVDTERKRMALGFVADIRRLDAEIAASKARIVTAVAASGTSVTDLYGVGPVVAAFLIGHSGNMARFANRDCYNGGIGFGAMATKRKRARRPTKPKTPDPRLTATQVLSINRDGVEVPQQGAWATLVGRVRTDDGTELMFPHPHIPTFYLLEVTMIRDRGERAREQALLQT